MIDVEQSLFLLIDMQEKLVNAVDSSGSGKVVDVVCRLLKAVQLFNIPVLVTEQNPVGLGKTVSDIANLIPVGSPVAVKSYFSAWDVHHIRDNIQKTKRKQIFIAGIEAHICVWQTAQDLNKEGYDVWIIADACASRHITDKEMALADLQHIGCRIVGYESVLFAWMKDAKHPQFKEIQALVKKTKH